MAVYQLKVSIKGTDPLVWRRVAVPDCITFRQLHRVFQECFEWQDCHRYSFFHPDLGRVEGEPDASAVRAPTSSRRLDELADPFLREGSLLTYTYDFRDGWEHVVEVEQVHVAARACAPRVLDFSGDSLIEGSGGIRGYYEAMRVLGDPDDPDHAEAVSWAEGWAPGPFCLDAVNARLGERCRFAVPHAARPCMGWGCLGTEGLPAADATAVEKLSARLRRAVLTAVGSGRRKEGLRLLGLLGEGRRA